MILRRQNINLIIGDYLVIEQSAHLGHLKDIEAGPGSVADKLDAHDREEQGPHRRLPPFRIEFNSDQQISFSILVNLYFSWVDMGQEVPFFCF